MTRSDWISLLACIAAFVGLVPPFTGMLRRRKRRSTRPGREVEPTEPSVAVAGSEREVEPTEPSVAVAGSEKTRRHVRLNPFGNAFVLTAMAAAVGGIELVIFGAVSSHFGVPAEPASMSTLWRLGFHALYLIPGILLLGAVLNILRLFED